MVAAALLHDVGHLIADLQDEHRFDIEIDDGHESLGALALAPIFGPELARPGALHVMAKRLRCKTDPTYYQSLSPTPTISRRARYAYHLVAVMASRRAPRARRDSTAASRPQYNPPRNSPRRAGFRRRTSSASTSSKPRVAASSLAFAHARTSISSGRLASVSEPLARKTNRGHVVAHLLPKLTGPECELQLATRGSSTHPHESEVPHRRTSWELISLEVQYRRPAREGGEGVHRAEDPAAYDHDAATGECRIVRPVHDERSYNRELSRP